MLLSMRQTGGKLAIALAFTQRGETQTSAERTASSKYAQLLLVIAKTGVERVIETDEATVTTWMNQQLEVLDINLATYLINNLEQQ